MLGGGILWASDHADAPGVTGTKKDITDLYVFQGANTSNLVFVGNVQGLLTPTATSTASFDENTMIEFKIDNNGDNVEDLVIQCVFENGVMYVYGPVKPNAPGLSSTVVGSYAVSVPVTPYASSATPNIAVSASGISAFAGPRDDPFFFDLNQFHKITGGTASSFLTTGVDTFAGTNVMSVVVEVPKSMLNSTGKIGVWLQTKSK